MSDFNPLDRARINTHRSSFDLSSKKLLTAKVGEILPCYWQIAIPGNKYRISSDWFTRTVPVNTAAYTRIKEYYDFYAVELKFVDECCSPPLVYTFNIKRENIEWCSDTCATVNVVVSTLSNFLK